MTRDDDKPAAPIACSLSDADAELQLAEWTDLGKACVRAELDEPGGHLWFEAGVVGQLRDIAGREAECCPFLELRVHIDGSFARLDISAACEEARPVIAALVGHAASSGVMWRANGAGSR